MNPLLQALQQRAKNQPQDIVLEGQSAGVSAAELLTQLQSLARVLRDSESRTVALYADNSPAWAMVDLACQLESRCLVPVPTFFSSAQVEHLLVSSGVDTLIYDRGLAEQLPPQYQTASRDLPGLPDLFMAKSKPGYLPCVPLNTTKITFTSGSTGKPKGVCLSFSQCLNVADSLARAINIPRPRHLCILPLSTLLENIGGVYVPLLSGGRSIIVSPGELGFTGSSGLNSQRFLAALERYQPNTLILVPQLLAVLDAAMAQGWQPPESLGFVAVGGARVAADMVRRVREKGLPVYEGYGLSECASVVSLNSPGNDRLGTAGRVLPHVHARERDGEIQVHGNTFLGYLDQPATWGLPAVSTGDVGTVDADGYVTIKGRSKNILITSFGRNVSPEWVESELTSQQFQQAIVLGEGRPSCAALLLPADINATDIEVQAAVDRANASLPDYARVGQWLRLDEPLSTATGLLTENGRPKRAQIQEHYSRQIDQLYSEHEESIAL